METISQFLLTFLFNSVWQISLIVTVAYLCQRLLQNASARIQHLLWVATLILSISIPILTIFNLKQFQSFNFTNQTLSTTELKTVSFEDSSMNLQFETQPEKTESFFSINRNLVYTLFVFYLLFIIYRVIKLFRALKQTQAIRNKAFVMNHSESLLSVIEEYKKAFKMPKAQILYSSEITSPITLGIFNPLIILPQKLSEENDRNILLSAIGHELVHIKRRDYLFNLLYEFIYLPLSFHPAMLLMKRRIKETRELRCDELVTDKLLSPNIYAQSLVQLAGSAIDFGRHSTLTIGIDDADILEKRIMKILKKSKMTVQQRNLLLVATSILFVVAFAVAITFTIRPVIAQQETKLDKIQEEKQKTEKEQILLKMKKEAELKYDVTLTQQSPEERLARQKAELEAMNKLAKLAKVSMAQAIEIATKEVSGTILECKLVVYNVKS
ncbi:MAG: M56 family metallopeptidase, partial [Acidobacteriota bacterium]